LRNGGTPLLSRESSGMSATEVKSLPTLVFQGPGNGSGTTETCAICLEDYEIGEKLRLLPCNHGNILPFLLVLSLSGAPADFVLQSWTCILCQIMSQGFSFGLHDLISRIGFTNTNKMWLAFVHCRVSCGLYRSMVIDTTTILSCLQEGCSHKIQWTCRLRDHPFAGGCSWSYLAYSCYLFSHPDLSNRLTSWVSNSISIFYPWIKRLLFTTRSRPLLDALCERGQSNTYWSGESHASLFKITKLGHHQFL
jgi:hypothetical protein